MCNIHCKQVFLLNNRKQLWIYKAIVKVLRFTLYSYLYSAKLQFNSNFTIFCKSTTSNVAFLHYAFNLNNVSQVNNSEKLKKVKIKRALTDFDLVKYAKSISLSIQIQAYLFQYLFLHLSLFFVYPLIFVSISYLSTFIALYLFVDPDWCLSLSTPFFYLSVILNYPPGFIIISFLSTYADFSVLYTSATNN